jgi:16S rRNA (cytosine967-C5)-methyltransferase
LIERLLPLQREILRRGADALRPGGSLVYSTCTISASENQLQLDELLRHSAGELRADPLGERFPELALADDPRFLQTLPDRDRTDGFFIARLIREQGVLS